MGAENSKFSSNDYELAIKATKELEFYLESEFKAEGRGLHEKINSCSSELPERLIKRMRYLATIRNKLIHVRHFNNIPDREVFIQNFEESAAELEQIIHERRPNSQVTCSVM